MILSDKIRQYCQSPTAALKEYAEIFLGNY